MINERMGERFEETVLLSEWEIQRRVTDLGNEVRKDYLGKNVLMVAILNGAMIFHSDLLRKAGLEDSEVDSMAIASYGDKLVSSGNPQITKDLSVNPKGRHVLLVEDIVHTGLTMEELLKVLKAKGAASVKVCTLLSKDDARKVEVPIDYIGFHIPDKWVEGYGLDSSGRGRYRKHIAIINMLTSNT